MPVLLLAVISVIVAITILIAVLHAKHSQYRHVPGPPIHSFWLGHLMYIKEEKDKGSCMAEIIHKWSIEYGHTFVFWVYHRPVVCTLHPDSIKDLLVTNLIPKSGRAYGRLVNLYGQRFLGNGLVTETDHKVWKEKRTALNHAFSIKCLRNSVAVFNSCGDELIKNLQTYADTRTEVVLLEQLQQVTLNIISKAAFGLDTSGVTGHDFHIAIRQVILGLNTSIADPINRILPWKQQDFKQAVRDSCHFLRETGRQIVNTRTHAIQSGESYSDDILNHMINASNNSAEDQELRLDDFITFFIAGMETTANLLSFLFMEIARNDSIRQKLREEIQSIFGTKDEVYFEDLSKLQYTELVIKETLRLYPSLPAIFRVITGPMCVGGYTLPADTEIMLNIYASGRYPEFYDDPFVFNPDRHCKTNADRPSTYNIFPFGLGPRSCIGQNFAMMEAKILLVKMIQNYHIDLVPEQSYSVLEQMTLRPRDGVKCKLRKTDNL